MTRLHLNKVESILALLAVAIVLANGWYGFSLWQHQAAGQQIADNIDTERLNLRRLRNIDALSAPRQELAQLQASAPAPITVTVPSNVDVLQLVFGLINFPPQAAVKIRNFQALEPKTETFESNAFQSLGFEVTLEGNPYDMLAMLRRVDDNPLGSLKMQALTVTRQDQTWTMKASLQAYLAGAAPAQPPATAKPAPAPTAGAK